MVRRWLHSVETAPGILHFGLFLAGAVLCYLDTTGAAAAPVPTQTLRSSVTFISNLGCFQPGMGSLRRSPIVGQGASVDEDVKSPWSAYRRNTTQRNPSGLLVAKDNLMLKSM